MLSMLMSLLASSIILDSGQRSTWYGILQGKNISTSQNVTQGGVIQIQKNKSNSFKMFCHWPLQSWKEQDVCLKKQTNKH